MSGLTTRVVRCAMSAAVVCGCAATVPAQAVCLPAPRLLTMTPPGGQRGTTFEVAITGDNLEDASELRFSHPGLTATPQRDALGAPVPDRFMVTIAADCPPGIHEARVTSRLGVSSSRVFNVGTLPEVTRTQPNSSLETALPLALDSICNAGMTKLAVDHYSFQAVKDQRVVVDCAAHGIDSKLKSVLIVADAHGNDLQVDRRGGAVDFTVPADGVYIVKVHDLTFGGGAEFFYRLALQTAPAGADVPRLPATQPVNSCSWPPAGLAELAAAAEIEPNNPPAERQSITLPCDLSGSFFPAADVDVFEFTAKKGEVWWVEVASERWGLATDPSLVVQRVVREGEAEKLIDVVELTDVPSPIKVSSNGYAYDGPPYNAGTADIIGKVEIPDDGTYRLRLTDLFGGTRNDPGNVYRLIVRQAQPDFALVGWGLHMELRNGDRNALSKPIALRNGATVALEVVAIRRDGFDGPIELSLDNLPPGVTATGLQIPTGQSRGVVLITADENAPRGLTSALFQGRAEIGGQTVVRTGRFAAMAWPVTDSWNEIPRPRLLADVPVSVGGAEVAPISIRPAEDKVYEAVEGTKLAIPLVHTRRAEFSGPKLSLQTFGGPFEAAPTFDVPLDQDQSEAVFDLAKVKVPPGEYTIACYGSAVAKYRFFPEGITLAELVLKQARDAAAQAAAEAKLLADNAQAAAPEQRAGLEQTAADAVQRQKAAEQAVTSAEKRLKDATTRAAAKDTVDIVVTMPIRVRVLPKPQTPSP